MSTFFSTNKHKIVLKMLTVATVFLSAAIITVHAQQQTISITLSPPLGDLILKPGGSATLAFNIENSGSSALEITPTMVRLKTNETGLPVYDMKGSVPGYFSLQNTDKELGKTFSLPPGTKDQLVLSIRPPDQAPEEDVYSALYLNARAHEQTALPAANRSKAQAGLAANILLTVSRSGLRQGSLKLSSFKLPLIVDTFSSINPYFLVKNEGRNLAVVDGSLEMKSLLMNRVVQTTALLPENVLAGSNRVLRGAQPDPQSPKSLLPASLAYHPPALLGPYEITLTLKNAAVVKKTIWALPISPILTGVLCWFILLWFQRKTRKEQRSIDNVLTDTIQ